MIIYNPAFDIYHCIYRLIILLANTEIEEIEIDKLRILDFYMIFPGEIKNMSFTRDLLSFKKNFKNIPSEFKSITLKNRVFRKMESYQSIAINCLASIEYIDINALKRNIIIKNDKYINLKILEKFNELISDKKYLIDFLSKQLIKIDLKGKNGLKTKTGLMESKYE